MIKQKYQMVKQNTTKLIRNEETPRKLKSTCKLKRESFRLAEGPAYLSMIFLVISAELGSFLETTGFLRLAAFE